MYDQALEEGLDASAVQQAAIDPDLAATIFFQEMANLAFELTVKNVPWWRIASALVERGCPQSIAAEIARGVEEERKAAVRRAAGRALCWALGWIALGAVVTAGSYSAAEHGGTYIVTTGLFLFGAINLLRALYYLASGRAPGPAR